MLQEQNKSRFQLVRATAACRTPGAECPDYKGCAPSLWQPNYNFVAHSHPRHLGYSNPAWRGSAAPPAWPHPAVCHPASSALRHSRAYPGSPGSPASRGPRTGRRARCSCQRLTVCWKGRECDVYKSPSAQIAMAPTAVLAEVEG